MKIEILKERENKPLARKEIDFKVDHAGAGTPSRADIRTKISAQFDADKESVIIKSLDTKFGAGITNGTARIYSETDQMKRIELDHIVARHKSEEKKEKKPEEKPEKKSEEESEGES
ncbi:MAG: 30S ribosomal protein S24e [Candidatus Thorarchaeota archaeon]|jgi:ribosomal protein S24E